MSEANDLFYRRRSGQDCPMCADSKEDDVVVHLNSGKVHLQNDADYPGYVILIFNRHAVELFELTEAERQHWVEDIARVGKAIWETCNPDKLNVSMLGNMSPHLHCHIIPRYPQDPEWGKPPAYSGKPNPNLFSAAEFDDLKNRLKERILLGG